ncbi:MAG: phosphatidylglycerophosphatase A [Acidobacteria bacterium]|nr:phosphatidylglycerophosphatase A [Acidobacteriota bacterium]
MTRLALLLSSFGFTGYCPIAPGTAGSAAGLLLFAAVRFAGSPVLEAATILAVTAAGVWSAGVTERHLGVEDPGVVVIDEVAGMLLTLAFVPVGWGGVVVGFVLFRLFDIIKPYPCSRAERLRGGWGIVADDVVAGLYGNLVLRLALWLLPAIR